MRQPQTTSKDDYLLENRLEAEGNAGAPSDENTKRWTQNRACLMEKVIEPQNLCKACRKVQTNHGAPGVDGVTTEELEGQVRKYYPYLVRKLKEGTYQPQPVKRIYIPKPDGSKCKLGIPRVLDRMVQQAIYQVLVPVLDHSTPNFPHTAMASVRTAVLKWQ